ncbi:MAG: CBS domain-containing protein [Myxococcota bacterium]
MVGVVTHRDLLRATESSLSNVLPQEQAAMDRWSRVSWIMERNVITVTPDTPLLEAAETLRKHNIGCLPVLGYDGVVGILTEADFVERAIVELSSPGD